MRMGGEIFSWGKAYKSLFGTGKATLEGRAEWYATHDPETSYSTPLPGVTPEGYIEQGINEKTGRPNETPIQPMLRWRSEERRVGNESRSRGERGRGRVQKEKECM